MKISTTSRVACILGAAILTALSLGGCVSSSVRSVKVSTQSPTAKSKSLKAGKAVVPPKPAIPIAKPIPGVPYFLPKVEVELTAILTNVPNLSSLVTTYSTTVTTSNYASLVNIYSNTNNVDGKGLEWVTNYYNQQASNSYSVASLNPTTNQIYLISITPVIIPDPGGLYSLQILPDRWKASSDNFNFQVDSNGFLQSLNATNADQTPQIVSELAQAATEIALAPGLPITVPPAVKGRPAPPQLVYPPPGRVDVIFDPTSERELQKANIYLIQKFVRNAANNPGLARTICPIQMGATFGDVDVTSVDIPDDYLDSYGAKNDGIVYRPLLPYVLSVKNGTSQTGINYLQYLIMSPNRAPVFALSVKRATFVTRTTSISFNNGFLGNVGYSNPSQLAAFLGLPVTIVNNIFSSVTNVLQLRFNIASAQNNIATQETALVNQEAALNNATTNLLQSIQTLKEFKAMQATNTSGGAL